MRYKNRARMGDKFEIEMKEMFNRLGFVANTRQYTRKRDGRKSEQDVKATKGELTIVIQCKDYAKFPFLNIKNVIDDLVEDGKSLGANRLVLAVTGYMNPPKDFVKKAKQKGIYFWDEEYWIKLQKLDLIDLYEEIGKNLEIEEVLKRVEKEEKEKLSIIYEKIEDIGDRNKRKKIFEELKKLEFSDSVKKEMQLKNIENEILIEKEKEVDEKTDNKIEDVELEELFSNINKSNLEFDKRYLILDKISQEIDLSKLSGRMINFEKVKTFIEKQKESSKNEEWGDSKIADLEELRNKKQISSKDYVKLRNKAEEMGVSKKGFANAERKNFDYKLKKAILKKKLIKLGISLGIIVIVFIILWGVLF